METTESKTNLVTENSIKELAEKYGIEIAIVKNSVSFIIGNEIILQGLLDNERNKIVFQDGRFSKTIQSAENHLRFAVRKASEENLREKFEEISLRGDYKLTIKYPKVIIEGKDLILKFDGLDLKDIKILTPEGTEKLKEIIQFL